MINWNILFDLRPHMLSFSLKSMDRNFMYFGHGLLRGFDDIWYGHTTKVLVVLMFV